MKRLKFRRAAKAKAKPRLLFVDHAFHLKTSSSEFIQTLLAEQFEMRIVYVDPALPVNFDQLRDEADYVFIWQVDFLAPWFIAQGKRVTVAQMYDGSANLPGLYYDLCGEAQFLNFSVTLHSKALQHGVQSRLVRYFPDPSTLSTVSDFSTLRGFFWQRAPQSPISLRRLQSMLAGQLDSLHVHTPADDGRPFDSAHTEGFECEITTSEWFDAPEELGEILDSCNVFIARRTAEGIGMAFLEAMARGMVVLAYDLPTHNEYISNWTSGILYSDQIASLSLRGPIVPLDMLSRNARHAVERGYQAWREQAQGICQFVLDAKPAMVPTIDGVERFATSAVEHYQSGFDSYVRFLDEHAQLCRAFKTWRKLTEALREVSTERHVVDKCVVIFFGMGGGQAFLGNTWSDAEEGHIWSVSRQAALTIPFEGKTLPNSFKIELRAVKAECPVHVVVNGVETEPLTLNTEFQRFEVAVPDKVLTSGAREMSILLVVPEDEVIPSLETRTLTFALRSVSF